MNKLLARTIIADRVRNFAALVPDMRPADVEAMQAWMSSPDFTSTCEAAEVEPFNVRRKVEMLIEKSHRAALSFL